MTDIVIIGEAWGEAEARERSPFVGASGYELTRMLSEAGIARSACHLTNVFNIKPNIVGSKPNPIDWFCGGVKEKLEGYPSLKGSRYVRSEFEPELLRLADELMLVNPNLIICLGNTAMWAMLGKTAVSKLRGTTDTSTHTASGFKVLPTYHPAAVLRQWELRPTVVLDLLKAARESAFPEIRRPAREIWIEPTLEDLDAFRREHIASCEVLSVDIETSGSTITCIGFAVSAGRAIVIPFLDTRRKSRSYWHSAKDERCAWAIVAEILSSPRPCKLFQNGLYDIAFLWRAYGIRVMGAAHDTMLLHHSLQPEALKGLGFLGSLYTDEGAWKHMRAKNETIKANE